MLKLSFGEACIVYSPSIEESVRRGIQLLSSEKMVVIYAEMARNVSEYGAAVQIKIPKSWLERLDDRDIKEKISKIVKKTLEDNDHEELEEMEPDQSTYGGLRIVNLCDEDGV